MAEVHIDSVPAGTMIYTTGGLALGVVRDYLIMNGSARAKPERHLDNNRKSDRPAYRRAILYLKAKEMNGGMVAVKA